MLLSKAVLEMFAREKRSSPPWGRTPNASWTWPMTSEAVWALRWCEKGVDTSRKPGSKMLTKKKNVTRMTKCQTLYILQGPTATTASLQKSKGGNLRGVNEQIRLPRQSKTRLILKRTCGNWIASPVNGIHDFSWLFTCVHLLVYTFIFCC